MQKTREQLLENLEQKGPAFKEDLLWELAYIRPSALGVSLYNLEKEGLVARKITNSRELFGITGTGILMERTRNDPPGISENPRGIHIISADGKLLRNSLATRKVGRVQARRLSKVHGEVILHQGSKETRYSLGGQI